MKRQGGFSLSYISFWKKAFDYKGISSLGEYWQPVGLHIGLAALAVVFYVMSRNDLEWAKIPFWILTAFLVISFVPFTALTVRRLRDTGMSGLWALLLLFVGAGTCVVLCLCAAGSSILPWNNVPVNVYGPPPWMESTDFDPSQNEPVDVYGPPEWFDRGEEDTEETLPFDPTRNLEEPLYGAPDWPTTSDH